MTESVNPPRHDRTGRLAVRLKGPIAVASGEPVPLAERVARLRHVTESVLVLPTLPTVVVRLLQLLDNPSASRQSLTKVIASDQVLTARFLKLANSSFYGYPQQISTVNLAVTVMGFDAVRDLTLSLSLMDQFRREGRDARFDMSLFWDHSLSVALGARHIAKVLRIDLKGEAFTAGLLHDIGKVILHQYQPKEFDEVVRRVHEEKMESWQAELDVMGATHSDVGGWLCARWNFPPALCAGVQFHHQPWEAGKFTSLAALVNLADRLLLDASPRGAEIAPLEKDAQLCAILSSEGVPIQVADLQDLARSLHQELEKSQELREVFA